MKRYLILGLSLCAFTALRAEPLDEPQLESTLEMLDAEVADSQTEAEQDPLLVDEAEEIVFEMQQPQEVAQASEEVAVEQEPAPFVAPETLEAPAVLALNEEVRPVAVATAIAAPKEALIKGKIEINMSQVFSGSPVIYSILLLMSTCALFIWLYTILSLQNVGKMPSALRNNLRNKLGSNNFEDALDLCAHNDTLFSKMMFSGIAARGHGLPLMLEAMRSEGKRTSAYLWQRLGLLNDIALIAPMLGLLGTVVGMFYAFYDVNRSMQSISTLFDGLGISVGTTVAGLIVSIIAMILHSLAKFRMVRVLSCVENETQGLAATIDDKTSIYKKV